ncbi:MAG TPA: hypothetical protein VF041_03750, partial [Gemmatimonadaceae bacterium]
MHSYLSLARDHWWLLVAEVSAIVLIFRVVRRAKRPTIRVQTLDSRSPSPDHPTSAPFRRADIEVRCATLRRREKPALEMVGWCVTFAIPFALAKAVPRREWMMVFLAALSIPCAALVAWQRRQERLAREVGLICPGCGAAQSEVLLYLGRCIKCRMVLLDEADRR